MATQTRKAAVRGTTATSPSSADGEAPRPESGLSWNPPTWLAWAAVGAAIVVTTIVVWGSSGPAIFNDEVSTLGMAKLIANPHSVWQLGGASYLPGSAILLAPVWWFTQDPATIYRAAIIILAIVSVAIIWPATRLAQALGTSRNAGMILGSILALAPSHVIATNYVWGEQLLSFLVVASVWRGVELAKSRTTTNAVVFAVLVGATYVSHGRAVVFAAAGGLALLALARKTWRVAWPAVLSYVVVVGGGVILYRWISTTLYAADTRASLTGDLLRENPAAAGADILASQVWYHLVPWLALPCLGLVYLVARARTKEGATFARWVLGAFGGSFAFFVVLLAGSEQLDKRVDLHVYGRYFNCFSLVLALLGMILVLNHVSGRVRAAIAAGGVVATGAFLVWTVPNIPPGGDWWGLHIPEVAFMLDVDLQHRNTVDPWAAIAFVFLVVFLLALMLASRRLFFVGFVFAYFIAASLFTDQHTIAPPEYDVRMGPPLITALAGIPEDIPVYAPANSLYVLVNQNGYRFWAYPRDFLLYSTPEPPPSDLVFASGEYSPALTAGALPLEGSAVQGLWIWVYPGELFDDLDAQGRIVHPTTTG